MISSFFGCCIVEMALQGFGVLGLGLGLAAGCIGEDFAGWFVFVGSGFFQRQGVLGRVEMIQLGLSFVAEETGELGQGNRLF